MGRNLGVNQSMSNPGIGQSLVTAAQLSHSRKLTFIMPETTHARGARAATESQCKSGSWLAVELQGELPSGLEVLAAASVPRRA